MGDVGDVLGQFPFLTDVPLVLAAFWLVMTGRIMPRRTVETLLSDKDGQIVDWRQAYRDQGASIGALTDQNDRLLLLGETTVELLREGKAVAPAQRDGTTNPGTATP